MFDVRELWFWYGQFCYWFLKEFAYYDPNRFSSNFTNIFRSIKFLSMCYFLNRLNRIVYFNFNFLVHFSFSLRYKSDAQSSVSISHTHTHENAARLKNGEISHINFWRNKKTGVHFSQARHIHTHTHLLLRCKRMYGVVKQISILLWIFSPKSSAKKESMFRPKLGFPTKNVSTTRNDSCEIVALLFPFSIPEEHTIDTNLK